MKLLIILSAWISMTLAMYISTALIISLIFMNSEDVETSAKVGCAWFLTSIIAAFFTVWLLVANGYLI